MLFRSRSTALTQGRRVEILVMFVLLLILGWVIAVAIGFPIAFLMLSFGKQGPPLWLNAISHVGDFIIGSLLAPIGTIAISLFYYDQRVRKEGFDLEMMLKSLGRAQLGSVDAAAAGAPPIV